MLDLLQNSWHVDVSISKAKRKSQIYHTCHLTHKCRAFNLRRKHDFGWTAPWWLKLLSFGDRLDMDKDHGRCRDITATRGQSFRGQGQGYYCLSQEFLASPLPLAVELWPFWASFYYFKSPPGETQIFFFAGITFVSNCQAKMVGYVGLIRANWCLSCFFLPARY